MTPLLLLVLAALPPDVPLPPGTALNTNTYSSTHYDQIDGTDKRGARVRAYLSFVPEGAQQPVEKLWGAWRPLLQRTGWKVVSEDGGTILLSRAGGWLSLKMGDYQEPLVDMITGPSAPQVLKLSPPAAKVEAVKANQDYPYLPRFPGATLTDTGKNDAPFAVSDGRESRVVASGSVLKRYLPPKTLSRLETELSYGAALKLAGWDVLPYTEGEGNIVAHYAKNGRDIWALIGRATDDSDQGLVITVADVGAEDWGAALDKACKLQLVGVHFAFDKATLEGDSDVVLARAATLINARPQLKFEVSGHTDDVGDAAYNQKLSEQRASAVVAWLASHGVAKAALVAKGYGKNQPIAGNDTDEGRAKNRRVQLACVK